MCGGHQKLFDIVIFNGLHSLDSASASVLAAEIIYGHPLNIAKLGHRNDSIFPWNQILCGKIVYIISNSSSSLITIFVSNCKNLFSYNAEKKISVCKNCQEFADFLL